MLNLIVIMFNILYPVFYVGFYYRVVCERECEDLRQLKTKEVFAGSLRVAFQRSEACAQHMTGMRRVMTDGNSWFLRVSRGQGLPAIYLRNILFCQFVIPYTPCSYPYYIYPHYPHMLKSVFQRENPSHNL